MPNSKNRNTGDQWDLCDRCGRLYPLGELTVQHGFRLCTRRCVDNLDIEYRDAIIAELLALPQEQEGEDFRGLDLVLSDLQEDYY